MADKKNQPDAFERVKLARHPDRPYSLDLFEGMLEDFVEIHGDRRYSDDAAMVCGFARLGDREVAVIGQQKGVTRIKGRFRNFGMPKPEGYRKALRIMKMAEKFSRPLLTFIDTPGAYPGVDAEERGQAEAIAYNLKEMARLKIPTIVVVVGEGGSGGALAIGIGDRVLMMENSIYSVISPEGCAAILWKDASKSERAANSLRLTASDLEKLGLIDGVVAEDGEWTKIESASENGELDKITKKLRDTLISQIDELERLPIEKRLEQRREKFRNMGKWVTSK